jgi:hypothetical protein
MAEENEIEIKFSMKDLHIYMESDSLKCSKYIKISELKNLIRNKNPKLNANFILIFSGKEMNNKMRLNDYKVNKQKSLNEDESKIFICFQSDLKTKFIYPYENLVKIKLSYNNKNEIFYVKEFSTLKKYISVYYGIPVQNQELYLNGIEKIYESPSKNINYIFLENITDFQMVQINIYYESEDKIWPLEIGRLSDKSDILHYLTEQYNFNYDKILDFPILTINGERIHSLAESGIKNNDIINLEIVPSISNISRQIDSWFFIFVKGLRGNTITIIFISYNDNS